MDTAVMNQTIWAVQDFIRDTILAGTRVLGTKIDKKTITNIQGGASIGIGILKQFLGDSWERRISTALELRKLEDETKKSMLDIS